MSRDHADRRNCREDEPFGTPDVKPSPLHTRRGIAVVFYRHTRLGDVRYSRETSISLVYSFYGFHDRHLRTLKRAIDV